MATAKTSFSRAELALLAYADGKPRSMIVNEFGSHYIANMIRNKVGKVEGGFVRVSDPSIYADVSPEEARAAATTRMEAAFLERTNKSAVVAARNALADAFSDRADKRIALDAQAKYITELAYLLKDMPRDQVVANRLIYTGASAEPHVSQMFRTRLRNAGVVLPTGDTDTIKLTDVGAEAVLAVLATMKAQEPPQCSAHLEVTAESAA